MDRVDQLENMTIEELKEELAARIQSLIANPKVPESIKMILRQDESSPAQRKDFVKAE